MSMSFKPAHPAVSVPSTTGGVLDPLWLGDALAPVSGGRAVARVEVEETIRTVATKLRLLVSFFEGEPLAICIKGLLDVDAMTARGGPTCVLEADFYGRIAPVSPAITVPDCLVTVIDREGQQALVIMRDLVAGGARFGSALEPLTADDAVQSLGQLAALHAQSHLLEGADWIRPRAMELSRMSYVTVEGLQALLDDPRGDRLQPDVRDGGRLVAAMQALAARDVARPQFLIHGDAHAGNLYRTAKGGTGLIDWQLLQRGGWALDVAYHINAVLPVEVAAHEERRLLGEYLAMMRGHGMSMPDDEDAWAQYREAAIYGFFLWAITRRVDPPIIHMATDRLGQAVTRLDSHRLLGIA